MQGIAAPVTHSHSAHRFFDGRREEGGGREVRGIRRANERFFM